ASLSLALRANAEKLEFMRNGLKPIVSSNLLFHLLHRAVFQLDDPCTTGANQMMVMTIVPFVQELETGNAVPKLEALDHPHSFEQPHGTIDGGQVAGASGQSSE